MSNDFDFDFSIDDILTEFTESTAASQPDTEQSSEEREESRPPGSKRSLRIILRT